MLPELLPKRDPQGDAVSIVKKSGGVNIQC